jgi:hypothetical protein
MTSRGHLAGGLPAVLQRPQAGLGLVQALRRVDGLGLGEDLLLDLLVAAQLLVLDREVGVAGAKNASCAALKRFQSWSSTSRGARPAVFHSLMSVL